MVHEQNDRRIKILEKIYELLSSFTFPRDLGHDAAADNITSLSRS